MESLSEWISLINLVNNVPATVQKGLLSHNVDITCIDLIQDFIVLGTNVGIVFWCERKSGEIERLTIEPASSISCIKIVESVDYLIAVGTINGNLNIFQVPKKHPPDICVELLIKNKPTERYTVNNLHHSQITCLQFSKNGMKLYSGDKNGLVVLSEFKYPHTCVYSQEILNEMYEIVQIALHQKNLMISTTYRSVICSYEECDKKWNVIQIGKKDRKTLNDFGATFFQFEDDLKIIGTRSGFRLWIADLVGHVSQTLIFKDSIKAQIPNIPVLNPAKTPIRIPTSFGRLYPFMKKYLITTANDILFVLNIHEMKIEGILTKLRRIEDLAVCGNEILILENSRSLILLSTMSVPMQNSFLFKNIELFTSNDHIANAEECTEELATTSDPNELASHLRKLEIFESIEQNYDTEILFKSQKKRASIITNAVVEIGHQCK